jgi:hypothetical protein
MGSESAVTTDDRGAYRVFGLAPGEYVIAATVTPSGQGDLGRRSEAEMDLLLARLGQRASSAARGGASPAPVLPPVYGFAPAYYPGTPVFDHAARVALGAAEERNGLDVTLAPIPLVTIEGTVTVSDGAMPPRIEMSYITAGPRIFSSAGSRPTLSVPPGPDGRFKYTNIPPGRYTIMARGTFTAAPPPSGRAGLPPKPVAVSPPPAGRGGGPPAAPPDYLHAVTEVDVAGGDVTGVALMLRPGASLSGRVVFDAAALTPPADLTSIRLRLDVPGGGWSSSSAGTQSGTNLLNVPAIQVNADGTFEFPNVPPSTYDLRASNVGPQWWLRSAMLDSRDCSTCRCR